MAGKSRAGFATLSRLGLLLLTSLACRDSGSEPLRYTSAPSNTVPNLLLEDSSSWDTWSADISISKQTHDSLEHPIGRQLHPIVLHLDRKLLSSGRWRTSYTFPSHSASFVRAGAAKLEPERFEVSRIEDDGDGSAARAFNGRGEQVDATLLAADLMRTLPAPTPEIPRGNGGGSNRRTLDAGRGWVRNFIIIPSDSARRRATLLKGFARVGTAAPDGFDTYVKETAGNRIVIQVDPALAIPMKVNDFRNGRRTAEIDFGYQRSVDGSLVITAIKTKLLNVGGSRRSITVETKFANIHLEQRN